MRHLPIILLLSFYSCKKDNAKTTVTSPPVDSSAYKNPVDTILGKYHCDGTKKVKHYDHKTFKTTYSSSHYQCVATVTKVGADSFHIEIDNICSHKNRYEKNKVYVPNKGLPHYLAYNFIPAYNELYVYHAVSSGNRDFDSIDSIQLKGIRLK